MSSKAIGKKVENVISNLYVHLLMNL